MRPSTLGLWAAMNSIDPFDGNRGDARAAMVVSAIANSNRDPKTRPQPFGLTEFLLYGKAQKSDDDRRRELARKARAAVMAASGHRPRKRKE